MYLQVTGKVLGKLIDLHDEVYVQACSWFQNLKSRFRCQILQHFGPMPKRDENIQVLHVGCKVLATDARMNCVVLCSPL